MEDKAEPGRLGTDFHFAMTGKSYQVLIKYFSSWVPKVSVGGGTSWLQKTPSLPPFLEMSPFGRKAKTAGSGGGGFFLGDRQTRGEVGRGSPSGPFRGFWA